MKNELKKIKKLHQKKFRYEFRRFIVEGENACLELIENHPDWVDNIYLNSEKIAHVLLEKVKNKKINYSEISQDEIEKISTTKNPQPILSVAVMPELIFSEQRIKKIKGPALFLDRIREPGNLGTILRTAAWFGVKDIILFNCVDLFSPKVIRSSAGALFSKFNYLIFKDKINHILKRLKDHKFRIIGTSSSTGIDIFDFAFKDKDIIIMGNEPSGISKETAQEIETYLNIPGTHAIDSLNVGVAAGIVLAFYYKQKRGG